MSQSSDAYDRSHQYDSSFHYDRAYLLIEQKRYRLAIEELLTLLAADPDSAPAYNLLSYSQARSGQFPAAISAAERAISLSPDTARYHARLADAYLLSQQYRLGLKAIATALQLDPQEPDYYEAASTLCHDGGDRTQDGLNFATEGLKLDPEHRGCLRMRVLLLVDTKNFRDADEDIVRSLQLFPDYAFPHIASGRAAIHAGNIDTAKASFKTALRIDPDNNIARLWMKEAIKAESVLYRFRLRYQRWQGRLYRSRLGLFFSFWFAIPYLRIVFWFMIGTNLAVGYLFDIFLRIHPYGRLLFTPKEKQINNCGTFTLIVGGLGLLTSFYTQSSNFFVAAILLGVSVYAICLRCLFNNALLKRMLIGVAALCMLAVGLMVLAFFPAVSIDVAANLTNLSARLIRLLLGSAAVFWVLINIYIVLRPVRAEKQIEYCDEGLS